MCVCFFLFFFFFTRWPAACWAYACSGSLPLDLYMFNYCILLLFMLWRIKFSLSLSPSPSLFPPFSHSQLPCPVPSTYLRSRCPLFQPQGLGELGQSNAQISSHWYGAAIRNFRLVWRQLYRFQRQWPRRGVVYI